MIIDTRTIPLAGLDLRGDVDSAGLAVSDSTMKWNSPIACALRLQVAENLLLVRGTLSCRVEYTCSRCLKKFDDTLAVGDFRAEVEFAAPFEIIDLTPYIRQDIILGLQYKPICSTDCRGLCVHCGGDLNRNPCDCKPGADDSPFSRLDGIANK